MCARRKSAATNARCFLTTRRPLTGRRSARFRRRRRNRPFVGAPLEARLQFVGRPGSHHSSAASSRWNPFLPAPASCGSHPLVAEPPRGGTRMPPHSPGGAHFGTGPARPRRRAPRARPRAGPVGCRLRVQRHPSVRLGGVSACLPTRRFRSGAPRPVPPCRASGVAERVAPSARTPTAPRSSAPPPGHAIEHRNEFAARSTPVDRWPSTCNNRSCSR